MQYLGKGSNTNEKMKVQQSTTGSQTNNVGLVLKLQGGRAKDIELNVQYKQIKIMWLIFK